MSLITYWIYSQKKKKKKKKKKKRERKKERGKKSDPASLGYVASDLQSESGTHIPNKKGLLGLPLPPPDLNLSSSPMFSHP